MNDGGMIAIEQVEYLEHKIMFIPKPLERLLVERRGASIFIRQRELSFKI
jgi:hypothetical protein